MNKFNSSIREQNRDRMREKADRGIKVQYRAQWVKLSKSQYITSGTNDDNRSMKINNRKATIGT